MRVTHVITRLIVGGAQENTLSSVLGLRRLPGIEADLVSGLTSGPEGSLEPLCANQPGLLTTIPEMVRPIHPWNDWLAYRKLRQLFQAHSPTIVHTHSGKAGFLGRLAAAKAGVPVVIHTIHGPSFGSFQGPGANRILTAAERRASRVTSHFVVVADAMKDQYLAAGIGKASQFTKIFSGFDLQPFLGASNDLKLRAKFNLAPDDIVIGKIARLFKLKGHDDLFAVAPELIKHCPKVKFLLVGDGVWRDRFERQAQALGLQKHFVFTGLVSPENVPSLVGIMDILVHLSRREGLARALPQALAAARPIVAYDCDGAREVCFNDQTGFLVQAGDLGELQKRLLHLAREPSLRHTLGHAGRDFVSDRFSVERMVKELHSLYLRLAGELPPAMHNAGKSGTTALSV